MTYRGIDYYMNRTGFGRFKRVVVDSGRDATPVLAGFHGMPTAAPSGTAAEGDFYPDTTAGTLKYYDGTQWVDAGGVHLLAFRVGPHASVTEYDLMVAVRPFKVVAISMVPSTLQGGALTGTLVKATATATPVKTTTPLHTADALNFNTGAYTVQNITLTTTTADLSFAAGERLGIDYSAALTAGHAAITVAAVYV